MNDLLLFMALSGTIPLLVYLFLRYKLHLHLRSPGQLYTLLKISLFFYLVPVPLRSNEIKGYVQDVFHNKDLFRLVPPGKEEVKLNLGKYFQILPDGEIIWPKYSIVFLIFLAITACVTIVLFITLRKQYKRLRNTLIPNSTDASKYYHNILEQVKLDIHLSRKVKIRTMDGTFSPLTFGIIRPVVIMPNDYSPAAIRLSLLHECSHIKKWDSFFMILGLAAIVIHWYLPFTYLLFHELKDMAEFDCDRKASHFMPGSDLDAYGDLIISVSSIPSSPYGNSPFISNFGDSPYKFTKERLTMLKFKKKKKLLGLFFTTILTAAVSAVSVAAYQVPIVYHMDSPADEIIYSPGPYVPEYPDDEKYFAEADAYFISDTGEVILLDGDNVKQARSCRHSYETSTMSTHTKNSSGGCSVTVYSVRRCSKCGYISSKNKISYTTYNPCPH